MLYNNPQSSVIQDTHYNLDTKKLTIKFTTNRIYEYDNVPREVYRNMLTAKSMGSYFYYNIRTTFSYKKVK